MVGVEERRCASPAFLPRFSLPPSPPGALDEQRSTHSGKGGWGDGADRPAELKIEGRETRPIYPTTRRSPRCWVKAHLPCSAKVSALAAFSAVGCRSGTSVFSG